MVRSGLRPASSVDLPTWRGPRSRMLRRFAVILWARSLSYMWVNIPYIYPPSRIGRFGRGKRCADARRHALVSRSRDDRASLRTWRTRLTPQLALHGMFTWRAVGAF